MKTLLFIMLFITMTVQGQVIIQDWQPDSTGCTPPLVLQTGQAGITSYKPGFDGTCQGFTSPSWIVFELPVNQQDGAHTITLKYVSSGNVRVSWLGWDNMGYLIKTLPPAFDPIITTITFTNRNATRVSFNMYQSGANWMTIDDMEIDITQPSPQPGRVQVIEIVTIKGYKARP